MSDSQDSPALALPPFDHVKADVILRSSDGVDFRVFRLFLSLASPFFETLFDLPQPSEETDTDMEIKDGLPVIPVSEDSKTLDSLLRFCYPCTLAEDPVLEDFREIIDVLDAAKKYSLDAIQQAVRKSLFIPKILETNSLRCFAIACRTRMQDECELAAKYTLQEPLIPGWFEEIELITSAELLSLLTYHQKCSSAVLALKDVLYWIPNELKQGYGGSCGCTPYGGRPGLGDWWQVFIDSTFLDLRDKPCAEPIRSNIEKTIQTIRQRGCDKCREVAPGRLREVNIIFTNKVEEVTSKVELDMKF
ncbi:hypothetical protein F5J12DRAFT_460768 [Pisolithus orientalis]|uniref:uncharacterized protein n=1 Tax=Pisolithus orientalis TaxID=936130 RepID=UPI002224CC7E|nr:uncharacterized protein F5J12DRAFT_460768 [Pisolithus orientalis]KAI5992315.1 hypothetical protein F5J12DRAFT_460768 [Pisolithus orientalis]